MVCPSVSSMCMESSLKLTAWARAVVGRWVRGDFTKSFAVMIPTLHDDKRIGLNAVYQAVFLVDAPRLVAAQSALQRLRLAGSAERCATTFLYQRVDFTDGFRVKILPLQVMFSSGFVPGQPHATAQSTRVQQTARCGCTHNTRVPHVWT